MGALVDRTAPGGARSTAAWRRLEHRLPHLGAMLLVRIVPAAKTRLLARGLPSAPVDGDDVDGVVEPLQRPGTGSELRFLSRAHADARVEGWGSVSAGAGRSFFGPRAQASNRGEGVRGGHRARATTLSTSACAV
jgi:hypothetical protein